MQPATAMTQAIQLAKRAAQQGEVPVGAVICDAEGRFIAQAHNRVEADQDATAHAELLAIRMASQVLGKKWLDGLDLYVTLEPCAMCAQAIAHARLRRVYFGAYDPKSGGIEQGARVFTHATCHHQPEIYGGLQQTDCETLLKDFFQSLRN